MMARTPPGSGARADQALALNMRLVAHHELGGFGGLGEGMAMQLAKGGRRILWLAHESAPKNFTGVDVTDPAAPRVVVQTDLPHPRMRSNSLDVVGEVMAVAYQTRDVGLTPAGFDLFDIAVPESPKRIAHFDCSGPHSRGVHAVWFVDGEFVHMAAGAPDFHPRHPNDDQCYRIVDVRNPSRPVEAGRWWFPGTREGDDAPPPKRLDPKFDAGFRAHNTNVYPERPDRAYVGYIDGGAGSVPMGTGLSSARASTIHTSLGQSAPLSWMHSSLTTSRLRPKSGSTVWVKPLKGGEWRQFAMSFGCALSAMSRITAPPSM